MLNAASRPPHAFLFQIFSADRASDVTWIRISGQTFKNFGLEFRVLGFTSHASDVTYFQDPGFGIRDLSIGFRVSGSKIRQILSADRASDVN